MNNRERRVLEKYLCNKCFLQPFRFLGDCQCLWCETCMSSHPKTGEICLLCSNKTRHNYLDIQVDKQRKTVLLCVQSSVDKMTQMMHAQKFMDLQQGRYIEHLKRQAQQTDSLRSQLLSCQQNIQVALQMYPHLQDVFHPAPPAQPLPIPPLATQLVHPSYKDNTKSCTIKHQRTVSPSCHSHKINLTQLMDNTVNSPSPLGQMQQVTHGGDRQSFQTKNIRKSSANNSRSNSYQTRQSGKAVTSLMRLQNIRSNR